MEERQAVPVGEHRVLRPTTVVATFNSATGWAGKTITRFGDAFQLEDYGPITPAQVLGYDRQGQLDWANDELREWVTVAATPSAPATPALLGRGVGIRFVAQLIDAVVVGAVLVALALAFVLVVASGHGRVLRRPQRLQRVLERVGDRARLRARHGGLR